MESFTNAIGGFFDKFNDFLVECCEEEETKSLVELQVEGAATKVLVANNEPQLQLVALEPRVRHELVAGVVVVDLGAPQVAVVKAPIAPKPNQISDAKLVDYCKKIYAGNFTSEDEAALKKSLSTYNCPKVRETLNLAECYKAFKPYFLQSNIMVIIKDQLPLPTFFTEAGIISESLSDIEDRLVNSLGRYEGTELLRLVVPFRKKWVQEFQIMHHYQKITQATRRLDTVKLADRTTPELIGLFSKCSYALTKAMNSKEVSEHPFAKHLFEIHVKSRVDDNLEACKLGTQAKFGQDIVLLFNPGNINPTTQNTLQSYHEKIHYNGEFKDSNPTRHLTNLNTRDALREVLTALEIDPAFPLQLPPNILFGMHVLIALFRNPNRDATNSIFTQPVALQQALTLPIQPPPVQPLHHYRSTG